jgi:hypothetical protein
MIYRMSNQLIWVWLEGLGNPLLLRLAVLRLGAQAVFFGVVFFVTRL